MERGLAVERVVKLREILPVNQMCLDMSYVSFSTKLQDKLNVPDEQEVGMPLSLFYFYIIEGRMCLTNNNKSKI